MIEQERSYSKIIITVIVTLFMALSLMVTNVNAQTFQNATNVTFGKRYTDYVTYDYDNNEVDLYKFSVSKAGRIDFNICTYTGSVRYELYNSDGEEVKYDYCDTNENVGYMVNKEHIYLPKGQYYLSITSGYSEGVKEKYYIEFKYTDVNASFQNKHNSFSTAQIISLNKAYKDILSYYNVYNDGVSNYYKFTVDSMYINLYTRFSDNTIRDYRIYNSKYESVFSGCCSGYDNDLIYLNKGTYYLVNNIDYYDGTVDFKITNGTQLSIPSSKKIYKLKGYSTTLKATSNVKGTVKWSSTNSNIVKVDSKGKITGVKTGTAYVKATLYGVTKTCKVTVAKPSLTVSKKSLTIKKGKSKTVKAKATPSKKISYSSTNKKIATVSKSGKVKAKKKGKCRIKVKANGITKYVTIKVTK